MKIYLYSPRSDQAQVFLNLLKKYKPDAKIYGVTFGSMKDRPTKYLDGCIRNEDIGTSDDLIIPMGARSTRYLLERGDIKIGEITLTSAALKVYDKPWILAQAEACGVPIPKTWLTPEEITNFPVFYKQRVEGGGGVRGMATSSNEIPSGEPDKLIYQEYIDSPG